MQGASYLCQMPRRLFFAGAKLFEQGDVRPNDGEGIAELVRQPADHGGDRFQPLKMVDLLFELFVVGDIPQHPLDKRLPSQVNYFHRQFNP